MVWAEKVMGRNGHGPKWLWAEMTSDHQYEIESVTGSKSIKSSPRELTVVELKSLQVTDNR